MATASVGSLTARPQDAPLHTNCTRPTSRRPDAEEGAKPARALESRIVSMLHAELSGLVGVVSRGPKQWQRRLRGEGPITLRDICELAEHPSAKPKLAVFALVSALVEAVRPANRGSLAEAVAAYSRETGDVAPAYIRSTADGVLTREELSDLKREVLEGRLRSEALLAEIDAQERRLSA